MTNNGIVKIHNKEYMTVAKRLELALEEKALESVVTEVLNHNPVVVKAVVTLRGKTFTGISSVSLATGKMIEKTNPYEVAETSAVGRALGFAGYGLLESVASADEVIRSEEVIASNPDKDVEFLNQEEAMQEASTMPCATCGKTATIKHGVSKAGKAWTGAFCETEDRSHTKWL